MPIDFLQARIEQLEADLMSFRANLIHRRADASVELEALMARAADLHAQSAETDYEPSAKVIVDLLDTVRRSLAVQDRVRTRRAA